MRAQALAARVPGLLMVVGADVAAALDDERRQTQRRMIAALYWRAGAALAWIWDGDSLDECRYWRREASALAATARAMEAAL